MQIALTKRTVYLLYFFGLIVLFSSVSLLAANAAFIFSDTIYEGINVGNIPVGGLSVEEAKNRLLTTFQETPLKSTITITSGNEKWPISHQDIDLSINADDLALQAHQVGRTGNIIKILKERFLAVNGGYTVPITINYNQDKLAAIITNISKNINRNPQNALLVYKDKTIHISPEVWGQQVNIESSLADIISKLNSNLTFTSELFLEKVTPSITTTDFANIDGLLAVYSTQFDPNNKNRYQNVSLAAQKINNILIHPNEVFSFNKVVGLRLPEYGYKEAPVLVDGKLLLDWGGGVCQVSTTLYNASLLADMEIKERSSHFQPPSYVPLGQDAAVADNLLDFRFKNTSQENIYIVSEVSSNQITVFIFGHLNSNPAEIKIETESKPINYKTVVKQDNSLPIGNEIIDSAGQKGFAVETYRVKSLNGKELSRENLSSDEFQPEDRVIRIGTKSLSKKIK